VALVTHEGELFYANASLARITRHEVFELMGQGFYDLAFPVPEARARLKELVLGAAEHPFDDLDLTAELGPDREKRNFHFIGGPAQGPAGRCLVLIVQDVTNRRAFEKVIESSFDNFIQVTNALDEAMKKIGEQNAILEEYKEKMTRELAIAKGVQKAIIPREFPKIPGVDLWGVAIPTDELGGDYFDWFRVDDDHLGILIADVSGHGVPSSLITTMVKSSFEYHTKRHHDPALVLGEVNRDLTAIIADTGFYLTGLYAVFHLPTREFRVAVAGHDPAYCLSGGKLTRLGGEGEGTILGVFPEARYSSTSYRLDEGSKVLACTDGIAEARAASGEFFGAERLEAFLLTQTGKTARQTVEGLVAQTDAFFGTVAPNDDRTLWVLDLPAVRSPATLLREAKQAFLDKNFQEAFDGLNRYFETAGKTAETCCLAGQALAFLNRPQDACELLEEAVRMDRRLVKGWYYLGLVRHNEGDRAGARTAWIRVRELDSQYKDIQTLLAKSER
jgi:serine phosphatase RsbU (regulator of sigma subunit)